MVDLKPKCEKCGKLLDLSDMRALADGKGFVCKDCFEQKPLQARFMQEEKQFSASTQQQVSSEPGIDFTTSRPEPVTPIPRDGTFADKEYVCDACGYIFKRSPEKIVKTCPYCGKQNTLRVKTTRPADDLLDEESK